MDMIRVKIRQAHRITGPDGRFKNYVVGDICDIPKDQFAPNLHKRIPNVRDKEDKNNDSRTKKR